MCCIDCRNQKRVLNPIKIFYVQGNQENRHRCATLTDIFLDPETGRVSDVERFLFYYLLKIIHEILLILLKNDFFFNSDIINNSEWTSLALANSAQTLRCTKLAYSTVYGPMKCICNPIKAIFAGRSKVNHDLL